ncbi:hypothetical protein JNJ66_06720 [Candidatus Saccharibacteria bacterium]|nr:hypothetical protein [Candidatus Saccharibacteria bacterium]
MRRNAEAAEMTVTRWERTKRWGGRSAAVLAVTALAACSSSTGTGAAPAPPPQTAASAEAGGPSVPSGLPACDFDTDGRGELLTPGEAFLVLQGTARDPATNEVFVRPSLTRTSLSHVLAIYNSINEADPAGRTMQATVLDQAPHALAWTPDAALQPDECGVTGVVAEGRRTLDEEMPVPVRVVVFRGVGRVAVRAGDVAAEVPYPSSSPDPATVQQDEVARTPDVKAAYLIGEAA